MINAKKLVSIILILSLFISLIFCDNSTFNFLKVNADNSVHALEETDIENYIFNGDFKAKISNSSGFLTAEEMYNLCGTYDATMALDGKSVQYSPFYVNNVATNGARSVGLMPGYAYLSNFTTVPTEVYLTYKVMPNTNFSFTYSIGKPANYTDQFTFKVFESIDGIVWNTEPSITSLETATSQTATLRLNSTTNFVKIVFPQTGKVMGDTWNSNAKIESINFFKGNNVGGFSVNAALKSKIADANGLISIDEMHNVLGVYDSTSLISEKSNNINYNPFQLYNSTVNDSKMYGLTAGYGYLKYFTNSSTELYLTYSVKAGSRFSFTYSILKPSFDGEFKFKVYESIDAVSWNIEPVFTSVETGTSQIASIQLNASTKYVKIVFPQTGISMGGVWNYNARIEKLYYQPDDNTVEYNYNAVTDIKQSNKTELGIFNATNVSVTDDGICLIAGADDGYVDYKLSPNTNKIEFVCENDVSFKISSDGVNWCDITAVPTNNIYTFALLDGYGFIRAELKSNTSITSVTADLSTDIYNDNLTSHDINADGNVNVLDFIKMNKTIGTDNVCVYNPVRYSSLENEITEFNSQTLICIKKALLVMQ